MSTGPSRRLRTMTLAAALIAAGFAGGWMFRGDGAEAQEDAATLAEAQLGRFYEALAGRGDLSAILGDAFQIMRTDGTRYDRDAMIAATTGSVDTDVDTVRLMALQAVAAAIRSVRPKPGGLSPNAAMPQTISD